MIHIDGTAVRKKTPRGLKRAPRRPRARIPMPRPRTTATGHFRVDAPTASPGRKPPFWEVKRPARPCKCALQNRFTVEKSEGA